MDVNNIPVNAIQEYDADSKTFSLRAETLPCGMSGPRVMGPEDWCGPLNKMCTFGEVFLSMS